jgi:HD-GYP domain-containing protein (c-di-GMP phosphodiesterase class II)
MSGNTLTQPAVLELPEVILALSSVFDLVEGHEAGHAARTLRIAMRLADELGLPAEQRSTLFYATLLKDAGCLTTVSRLSAVDGGDDAALTRTRRLAEWPCVLPILRDRLRQTAGQGYSLTRALCRAARNLGGPQAARLLVLTRCSRAVELARMLHAPAATAEVLRGIDEQWDGRGLPAGAKGNEIPLLARITGLAQNVQLLVHLHGAKAAHEVVAGRRGTWFDPLLVDALGQTWGDDVFWGRLDAGDARAAFEYFAPEPLALEADELHLDLVAEAFATAIDAKSTFTYRHSEGVATLAVAMGELLGFSMAELRRLRRAALLHDLGKLKIPNRILDKRGALTGEEARQLRRHPAFTYELLSTIAPFRDLADVASSHHERLDGTGYHRGLTAEQLPPAARILAVADTAEALSAERPYHPALPWSGVLRMMGTDAGVGTCAERFAALAALAGDSAA